MRRYRHGLSLAASCALAASTAPCLAATPVQDEAVYSARFTALMNGQGEHYAPLEAVPGEAAVSPLPVAKIRDIDAAALAAAAAYVQANNSNAFLVWHHGVLESELYFNDVTRDTPIVSKSLAKPLSAIVIGRAIALGRIESLDQPVSDFITEWRGTSKAAILVRHLLDMRSGLLGQHMATDPADILNRAYLHPRHDDILINTYPLIHPPGTRFDYANAVADLIAIVIERATGQRYAAFVSREVLAPLGAAGGTIWIDRPGGLAHSACCIMLPAQTWLRLAILLLDDGVVAHRRLLPEGFVGEMRRATPQNPYYGLGVYVAAPYARRRGFGNPDTPGPQILQSEPYLAKDLFLFDGNADQVVYMIPSERLIILRTGGPPPKAPEWDNAVLPNAILRGLQRK